MGPTLDSPLEAVLYGLAQPWLGVAVLAENRPMARRAALPVAGIIAFCALVALGDRDAAGLADLARAFYLAFAGMAAVPPILFGRHYARLAADGRNHMGLGPALPFLRSLPQLAWEAISQVIVIAIALAPLIFVAKLVPVAGGLVAGALATAWALHWIVVEALDSGRTLKEGQRPEEAEALARRTRYPWFVRIFRPDSARIPWILRSPMRTYGWICHRLGRHWQQEIALVEAFPWVALGFGLSTATLLAIPVLNLAFRPVIVIAGAHVLAQLEPLVDEEGRRRWPPAPERAPGTVGPAVGGGPAS